MARSFASVVLLGLLSPSTALHPALAGRTASCVGAGRAARCASAALQPALAGRVAKSARVGATIWMYEGEKYTREVRIKEELASPFRGFRFFAYAGMLMGGGASGYIALTGYIANLAGRSGPVERDQLVTNLFIDFGAFALGGGLLWLDIRKRTEKLDEFAARAAEQTKARRGGAESTESDLFIR